MNNVTTFATRTGRSQSLGNTIKKTLRIHLLGTMKAMGPHGENILPRRIKTQGVLAYLCLAEGERVPRARIAGMIWDRAAERGARDNLRQALNELLATGGGWRLETGRDSIRLDISDCWIDAFEPPDQPDQLLEGLHGISAAFDHWLIGRRVRFENGWQQRLEQDLDELITRKAPPASRATAARRLLNFMPTYEPAVRALMTAYLDMGEGALAIREYERFKLIVEDAAGVGPADATIALYEKIRRGSSARRARATSTAPTTPDDAVDPEEHSARVSPGEAGLGTAPELELKLSIAALPLRNLSGKPRHDRTAEGLTDDIVEALSRVPGLFVVSRLSAAAFKHRDRPAPEIGSALGVRYLISGSLRAAGDRLRIIAELTETRTSRALWVQAFDEIVNEQRALQTGIAQAVVCCIAPHLRAAEVKRVQITHAERHSAYDFLLRAQEAMHDPSRATFETAQGFFERAIARDPRYSAALGWRAYWHVMRVGQGWSPDPAQDTEQADHFAQLAVECDPTEPMALAVQGHVATYLHKDFDLAFACFDKALQINPNASRAWLWNANAHAYIGEGTKAVEKVNRAMALAPYDPLGYAYSGGASLAYLADGQYPRAIEFALRSIRENRGYTSAYKLLISALALGGQVEEARSEVCQLLRLEPGFTVEEHQRRFPGSGTPFGKLYCEALAKAGVPALD
jgi:TolB-like protein/DNA-binding SARP family transcriptional activator